MTVRKGAIGSTDIADALTECISKQIQQAVATYMWPQSQPIAAGTAQLLQAQLHADTQLMKQSGEATP